MTTQNTVSDFNAGDRVTVESTCWLHKAGATSGEVVKVGRTKIHVRADVNGVVYQVAPRGLARS